MTTKIPLALIEDPDNLVSVTGALQAALDLKAPKANPTFTGTVTGVTKTHVGLGSVDNTADTAKPVSTAQQTALNLKANLASPALTGTPTAPTAAVATDNTQVATTAFARDVVQSAGLLAQAPSMGAVDMNNAVVGSIEAYNGTHLQGTTLNWPFIANADGTAEWWNVITYGTTSRLNQIATYGFQAGTGRVFSRVKHDSTWFAWVEQASKATVDLKAPIASPTFTGTVAGITKAMVGLTSVDDTSDANKPVSTAQAAADALKVNLDGSSAAMTGQLKVAATGLIFPNAGTLAPQIFRDSSNRVAMSSEGVTRLSVGSFGIQCGDQYLIEMNRGTASLPGISFNGDPDTGIYSAGANLIDLVAGGKSVLTTLAPNYQTGTTYTLVLTDVGKRVSMSNAAANVLTVPPNSSVAFPIDTIIYVYQAWDGATTIAAGSGVTINTSVGLKVGGKYKMISLIKESTDLWVAIGSVA